MWENYSKPEEAIAKELLKKGSLSVSDISIRTNLPTWKVSRNLKRLEIRGCVHHEVENRHERGRPRKFYDLESKALRFVEKGGGSDE